MVKKLAPSPFGVTVILELEEVYPIPVWFTTTESITPAFNTGTRTVPLPSPSTTNSGGELYPEPPFLITTDFIFPSWDTIGINWASFPLFKVISDCLL